MTQDEYESLDSDLRTAYDAGIAIGRMDSAFEASSLRDALSVSQRTVRILGYSLLAVCCLFALGFGAATALLLQAH